MLVLLLLAALCADPDAKAESAAPLPENFREYFKAADENKRDIVKMFHDRAERAKIALNSADPDVRPLRRSLLATAEADLKGANKMKAFAYIDPLVIGSVGVFRSDTSGGRPDSANVIGVIDKTTIVVGGSGRLNVKFKAVLRVPSSKGVTASSRIGMGYVEDEWSGKRQAVWVVSGLNGAEDPRVATLLRVKPDAEVPVFEVAAGIELRRKQYEAEKALMEKEPQ